jgi:putative nucleotidyltransferase with HDIG domain
MSEPECGVRQETERLDYKTGEYGDCNPRVLIVEDDEAARKLLGLFVRKCNWYFDTADNAASALVALERRSYDVVISDLRMPGMGGMELLERVRQKYKFLAFVITTGVDDVDMGVEALKSGADDYLVKPLFESAVLASVKRSVLNRRLAQEVEYHRLHLESMVETRTRELHKAVQEIERNYEDTLQALGAAVDLRDIETSGHCRRVSRYAVEIAGAMCLTPRQVSSIARGAYLHDIGKLGIPDGILFKPGPLTYEERKVMQKHVELGFDLVKGIQFLEDAAEVILTHHERFDGSGYPRGLKGDQIPVVGRTFAVADTFDAITTDRPYQRAISLEMGRENIRHLSGTHFDPQVVQAFLSIPLEIWRRIANDQRPRLGVRSKPT